MASSASNRLRKDIGFREPPIERILFPFQKFFRIEAASGIVLLVVTVIALVWANSDWAASYSHLWETELGIVVGRHNPSMNLHHWINDGLMAVFFFFVGLEIKREVLIGELSSWRQAVLPIAAAVGGMICPALVYVLVSVGSGDSAGLAGWGIPMATDIAFALGVLALVGRRAPTSLKVFLTALAIVDDLGAVLVIAIFYTAELQWIWLGIGASMLAALFLLNRLGVRHSLPYGLIGLLLWFAFLQSGVHATIAGVLAAMAIPARAVIDVDTFADWGSELLHEFRKSGDDVDPRPGEQRIGGQRGLLQALETGIHHAEAPLQRLEHSLQYPVAFVIMPIFALANAGVSVIGNFFADLTNPVSMGILLGLVVGKQVGIFFGAWIVVRVGLARLPANVSWRHVYGTAWLAGIGFTMALFIGDLAFGGGPLSQTAKVGILVASAISGVVGFLILRSLPIAEKSGGGLSAEPHAA